MLRATVVVCLVGLALATPVIQRSKEEIESFRHLLEGAKIENSNGARFSVGSGDPEENGKYQGDILLDDEQIQDMLQQFASGRNAYIPPESLWPNNTVVWEFVEGEFNEEQKEAILQGIKDIEDHSCVKFRYREPQDVNYVALTGLPNGCYAHVGYSATRGVHLYNLARNEIGVGCFRYGTIVHEWLHILGFFHMHSSHERNDFVRIVQENLIPGTEHNFAFYTPDLVTNHGVEYDYISCMHYGPYAFTNNGEKTIIALKEHEGTMGQRVFITESDWIRLRRQYRCPGAWD